MQSTDLLISEVWSCLDENPWTDFFSDFHPNLKKVIAKSSSEGQFKCLVCQKHRNSYTGANLKTLVKHFHPLIILKT